MSYKLCYISSHLDYHEAYFTKLPLSEQWGDDWDDAPYEHNAGMPYEDEDCEMVLFSSPLQTPAENGKVCSVRDINNKIHPWLHGEKQFNDGAFFKVWAGCSISMFKKIIKDVGGKIYVEEGVL